jgi:signal transduction histidine kinase/CheY-like chemotaxis protein/HPt (histidine-containing phosphotransfer) domain-containing protein
MGAPEPTYDELKTICSTLQEQVSGCAAAEDNLTRARDTLDRELNRLERIHSYAQRGLRAASGDEFVTLTVETAVEAFAVECAVLLTCGSDDQGLRAEGQFGGETPAAGLCISAADAQALAAEFDQGCGARILDQGHPLLEVLAPLRLAQAVACGLHGEDGDLQGLIVAGRTRANQEYYDEIDQELLGSFSTFARHAAALMHNLASQDAVRRQMEALARANADLHARTKQLHADQERLADTKDALERRVAERTADLEAANEQLKRINEKLRSEIAERERTETRLREANWRAEQATRAKSDFLARMSHEIRTPMNGIVGMTELAMHTKLTAEQREYLNMVRQSADLLLEVINDILDFSKIEAGKLSLERVDFSLRESLGDALTTLGIRADAKGLELILDIGRDVPDMVVGDPVRLRQIIMNLVGNAVKFTNRGEVSVRMRLDSGNKERLVLRCEVADTGVGIPPEKQKNVFNAFEQADGSVTRVFGGTGLGLAITAQLVEMMGGQVYVTSELGRGSTFGFTLPLGVSSQPAPRDVLRAEVELENLPVLVVDDNHTNRIALKGMLSNWRMKPVCVESGQQALGAMKEAHRNGHSFPLVILDVCMPEMDGFTVAQRIKDDPDLSAATVMMLSSAARRSDADRCRKLGVAQYLSKPVRQSALLDAIVTALGSPVRTCPTPGVREVVGQTRPLRVLVAEDNLVNQKLAVCVLEKWGHTVRVAQNGRQALQALDEETFDLVLMDVQMPKMDGYEATTAIRENEKRSGRHVPILAMTAHAMKGDRERCLQAGMDGYVSKPIGAQALAAAITEVLPERMQPQEAIQPRDEAANKELEEGRVDRNREQPSGATDAEVFDAAEAFHRLDGDMQLLRELVGLFMEDRPNIAGQIAQALDDGDMEALARAAHSLKGALGNLAARRSFAAALNLETVAREGNCDAAREAWSELETEISLLESALKDVAAKGAPSSP